MRKSSWLIDRRTMLKGVGVGMALPFLNVMVPPPVYGSNSRGRSLRDPVRFCTMYVANGIGPQLNKGSKDLFTPDQVGPLAGPLPRMLAPYEKHRDKMVVFSGLYNKHPLTGVHQPRMAGFLTSSKIHGGANLKGADGTTLDVETASIDQIIAQQVGHVTKLPSMQLAIYPPPGAYLNYSSEILTYGSHLSWRDRHTPLPNEVNPQAAFDRLFRSQVIPKGGGRPTGTTSTEDDQSVLDAVLGNLTAFNHGLGVEDKRKMDEYATTVRELERQLGRDMKRKNEPHEVPKNALLELPGLKEEVEGLKRFGRGADVRSVGKLMLDIMAVAFWTDSTRVCTFHWSNETSGHSFSFLGKGVGSHHEMSHHQGKADKFEAYSKICVWHMEQCAYLIDRLANMPEAGGTVLDNSMVLIGSGMRDGQRHSGRDLPLILAGGGRGTIQGGRHLQYPSTPMANLHCEIAARMGVELPSFADSTGPLQGL